MKLLRTTLIISILLLGTAVTAGAQVKRVLILTGSDPNHPGFSIVTQTIRSSLRGSAGQRVEFTYELQPRLASPGTPDEDQLILSYLKQKYQNTKVDLIFSLAAPRLREILKNDPQLFVDTPKVFYEFEFEREPTMRVFGAHATGVWAKLGFSRTLELALAVNPDTERVYLIAGSSRPEKTVLAQAQNELAPYARRLQIIPVTDVTLEELKIVTDSLPARSIVMYLIFSTDKAGNIYPSPEALKLIAPTCKVPIFGNTDTLMGSGILGGNLLDFQAVGRYASELGQQILEGQPAQTLPSRSVPTVDMVDWREIRRFGISEKRLPAGTVIKFREPSLWELYKWYIIGLVAAVIIEAVLIAWLLFLRRQRLRVEIENEQLARKAEAERKQLDEVVSNVPGLVWETRREPGSYLGKTTFISDHVEQMLGYTPAEWLSKPAGFGASLIPDEADRARVHDIYVMVVDSGKPGSIEFRWQAKDGRIVWVEAHVSPVFDENHQVIGLRGVTLDVSQRKLAEENLRETRQTSEAIVRAIPDLIFLQTADGVYVDYHCKNPRELLLPPEQFLGRNIRDVMPPALAADLLGCFQRVKDGGAPELFEYQLPMNGSEKWYEARIVRSGEMLLSVVRDITQRKLDELAIKESETNYRSIFNNVNDAIFILDLDTGEILDVNERMCEMFGYTVEEAANLTLAEFTLTEAPYRESDALEWIHKASDEPQIFESHAQHKSGRLFWVSCVLKRATIGNQDRVIAVVRDISDSKEALSELRASEERFGKAFRANPQPMSVTTIAEGRYLDVNDSFLTMSGYAREEVLGQTSLALGIWGTPEIRKDFISKLTRDGSIVNTETNFYGKNGRIRTLLSSAEIVDIAGEACLLVASSDITERKDSQAALLAAHQELIAAHEEVKRLKNQLQEENIYLREEISLGQDFGEIVGQSDALKYVLFKVEQVSPTETTVLITGETGTGKELIARAIHSASARHNRPLVRVNCAALSPTIIESELFGHERGSFTGATARKIGRFELADGATIFLDEIGELPPELQGKLLRVIQEGELERLGSSKTIQVDVRIIAATNRNLENDVKKGLFREDLWYRLNVFPITVPPLRQRRDDIKLLVEHFVRRFSRKLGKVITSVSPATLKSLTDYGWPGNVRELANVIERATITATGSVLRISDDFGKLEREATQPSQTLEEMERDYILRILSDTNWRIEGRHGAARILGMNPSTLRTRMAKLGIERPGQSFSQSAN